MSTFCSSRWVAWFDRLTMRAVPERVQRNPFIDTCDDGCGMAGAVELALRERLHGIAAGKQPALRPLLLPIGAQQVEKSGRQHHVSVLMAFALLDPDHHARAVDIGNSERDHFGGAQTGRISHAQRGPVLEAGCCIQEALDFLRAQDHRQLARRAHERQPVGDRCASQRHAKKEAQRGHRRIQLRRRGAAGREMKVIAPKVLCTRLIRRATEESGELFTARMYASCVLGANLRLVISSIMRRRNALTGASVMGVLLSGG